MRQQVLKKGFVVGISMTTAFLTASCAIAPRADGPANPAADSSWTYERRDTGSFGKDKAYQTSRVLGEQMWQGRKVRATELPQGTRVSDFDKGDWLAMLKGDQTLVTWEPSLGYDWPITVGKTFTRNYRVVNHVTKQTTDIRSTMTVEAYEEVTVPAGTFKAFRVLYTDSLGVESVNWYSAEAGGWVKIRSKRSSNFPAGAGTQDFDLLSYTYKK